MTVQSSGSTPTTKKRPDLADALETWDEEANAMGFVADDIMPVIEVPLQSGTFPYKEKKDLILGSSGDDGANPGPRPAPGGYIDDSRNNDGGYKSIDHEFGEKNWRTQDRGLKARVDARRSQIYEHWEDHEEQAAILTRETLQRNRNYRVIDTVLGHENIANVACPTTWDDETFDLIGYMKARCIEFRNKNGLWPNLLVLDLETYVHIPDNAGVLNKYVGSSDRTDDGIGIDGVARALNLPSIRISGAQKNTAGQPLPASLASMWPKDRCLLMHTSADSNTKRARLANTFHWGEDGSVMGGTLETYWDEDKRSDFVRHRMEIQEQIIDADMGMVITGVL